MARPPKIKASGFLPEGAAAAIRRVANKALGLAMLVLAAVLAAALFGFTPGDPSFNIAADRAAGNPLGRPGSILADLMLQALGLAALLPPAALAVYGLRLGFTGAGPSRPWLRLLSLIAAAWLLAVALGPFPLPIAWSLPAGAGGFLGRVPLDWVTRLGGPGLTTPV
ncbi:MAG: DNA translocase FtsK 4TM domain-containing protein, partial [Alphaproteobacteria bacterium]|nr:DNA translocase FtsK 4TM domain-containing protein [Alphaproteobacteria bacterium]